MAPDLSLEPLCGDRITPYFETAAPQYAWLTKTVTNGFGRPIPGGVGLTAEEVAFNAEN